MAQDLQTQPWRPLTSLSPTRKWEIATAKVRYSTSPQRAAQLGKQLLGQWPHANPPDPQTYSLSIAQTLQKYPLGVAEECCDPQLGLARFREFPPTVAAIVEWCELTTRAYVAVAQRGQPPAEKVEQQFSDEHRKTMLGRLRDLWKGLLKPVTQ
jgi:hypothetical protein